MYARAVRNVDRCLQNFSAVNKIIQLGVLAGGGGALGSMFGHGIVTPVLAPSWSIVRGGLYGAFLGLGIGLSIAVAQSWHVGRLALAGSDLLKASALSGLGGLLGGSALVAVNVGTGLVFDWVKPGTAMPHILGWTVEGAVLGFFVAKVIPNLPGRSALLAGAVAGLLGGVLTAFYVPVVVGDVLQGVFLGLAIGIAERVGRRAWVILRRESPEGALISRSLVLLERPPTLLLGQNPLLIGTSRECEIVVAVDEKAPAIAASLELSGGRIVYRDNVANRERALHHGAEIRLNGLILEIGSKLTDAGHR